MIYVKKRQEDTSQKVVATFLKRVKKSNLVARVRKTKFSSKDPSALQKKRKALTQVRYQEDQKLRDKVGKL